MARDLSAVSHGAIGVITLAFAWACAAFVRQPTLATFADDSVSYLVMAQVFSPWQSASAPVRAAFPAEAFYPPFFPLVLALAGAAHDIARAHVLTALILAASLPAAYALGIRWLASRGAAAAAVLVIALLPALWINAKGILSEPLFCLLLLAALLAIEAERRRTWLVALLMAGMLLTRTAAIAPIGAYAIWAFARSGPGLSPRAKATIPALVAVAAYALWLALRPAATGDSYARILMQNAAAIGASGDPWALAGTVVARQLNSIYEAWLGSLLVFWYEGRPAPWFAAALGLFALSGLLLRVKEGKADGWMTGAYLLMFLVWPFYDQMGRFLFPVLPVLVLYAFLAAGRLLRAAHRPASAGYAAIALLALSLAVPAIGFIYQRARSPDRAREIVDWYRTPDLAQARSRAEVHLGLFDDMQAIRSLTRADDAVMWSVPSYLALLAGRPGVKAPDAALGTDAYLEAVRRSGARYVFLSRYHPRDTLSDAAWQAGTRALAWRPEVVRARALPGGAVASLLIRTPK